MDEIALFMDLKHPEECGCISVDDMVAPLERYCQDYLDIWEKYWLRNGERFSAEKCVNLTLNSFVFIFNKATLIADLNKNKITV